MKKRRFILSALVAAVALALCIGAFGLSRTATSAQTPEPTEAYAQENVVFGSDFTLPSRTFELGGVQKTVTARLISPSGLIYDASAVKLNEAGIWTVRFCPEFDKVYFADYMFTVYRPTFEVTGGGSVAFGVNPLFEKLDDGATTNDGLIVNIPKGGEFRYNNKIALSKLTKNDTLITLGLIPSAAGSPDVSTVKVTLTDIYDKNNKIVYEFVNPNDKDAGAYQGMACVAVSFTGSGIKLGHSISNASGKQVYWTGSEYYGAYTPFSFDGMRTSGGKVPMTSLSLDYARKRAHCQTKHWYGNAATGTEYTTLIADLTETEYADCLLQGAGKGFVKPFEGFTTGEAYLSISAGNYYGSDCGIFVRSIAGADFGSEKSYDHERPILKIDTKDYSKSDLPKAKTGLPYKLFAASAADNLTEPLEVDTAVYFMRGNTRSYSVPVRDGKFTPTVAGVYAAVYSAVDGSGFEATEELRITASENVDKPIITLESDYATTGKVGAPVRIADYSATAYSGKASVTVSAAANGKDAEIKAGEFVPDRSGTYAVTVTATDYIGQSSSQTYNVAVEADVDPIIESNPVLPYGFIHGMKYKLPSAVAYDYYGAVGEKKEIVAEIYVTDENGEHKLTGGEYTAFRNVADTVKVRYDFVSGSGKTKYEKTLPIITASNYSVDFAKYFVGGGSTQNDDSITLSFAGSDEINYIKAVPSTNSVNSFGLGNSVSGDRVDVYFRDTSKANNTVKVSFTAAADGAWNYSVNDGAKKLAVPVSDGVYEFTFASENKTVRFGAETVSVDKNLEGEPYSGMSFGRAYISYAVSGKTELDVKSVSGFGTAKKDDDYSKPVLYIAGEVEFEYEKDSAATVFKAYASDMLQENVTVTVTATAPDGTAVVSTDGITLTGVSTDREYSISLSMYGRYSIRYTAESASGYSASSSAIMYVSDKEAPVISLSMEDFTCKANKTISIPTATFTDNRSSADKIKSSVSYTDPFGRTYLIKATAGDKLEAVFAFDTVGLWKLTYTAYDEYYNVSFKTIYAEVK